MKTAKLPENELDQLTLLKSLDILEPLPEQEFDDLTILASQICDTPIAYIALLDEKCLWFKSKVGIADFRTPAEFSFCSHTIADGDVMVVENMLDDPRFFDHPLVVNDPCIRFYAGIPLKTNSGFNLGGLCVADTKPKKLKDTQQESLKRLARQIVTLITTRLKQKSIDQLNQQLVQKIHFNNNITDTIPAMIAYWNADLRCQFMNTGYLQKLNKDLPAVLGNSMQDVLPKACYEPYLPYALEVLKGVDQAFEFSLTSKNNSPQIFCANYIPDFNTQQKTLGFFALITDITAIKRAEENNKLAVNVFEQTSEAIFITDAKGIIISVNSAFAEMTGYAKEEVIGKTANILKSNRHDRSFYASIKKGLQKTGSYKGELWNQKKDGELFYAYISIDCIKDNQNNITHLTVSMIDNTENEKMKSELMSTSDMLNRTGKMAKVGGWDYDLQTKKFMWTKEMFRIFELDSDEIPDYQELLALCISEDGQLALKKSGIDCVNNGTPWDLEFIITTIKRNQIWVKSTGECDTFAKGNIKLTGTLQDITERKNQELQRMQNEINHRNTLVREVHHRIKNNLQGVSGILHNFATKNPALAEPFNLAISQLESVAIISGLQGKTADSSIELSDLTAAICHNIENIWQTKIALSIESDWVKAYISKNEAVPIALILNELITNANKHQTQENSVSIHIKLCDLKLGTVIIISNIGDPISANERKLNTLNKSGLALIDSLMPKTGAKLEWNIIDKSINVELALLSPVISCETNTSELQS